MEDARSELQDTTTGPDRIDPSQIKGWGVDADPYNDPTYPIKNRNNGEHAGYTWERPPQQRTDVEVLHSNERPNVAATFGTSTPPSGLSGMIRRAAFRFSENSYGHWLPLIVADRVNMLEGIASDLLRGRIPNVLGEMGMKAAWQHDKKRVVTRALVGVALVGLAAAFLSRRSSGHRADGRRG